MVLHAGLWLSSLWIQACLEARPTTLCTPAGWCRGMDPGFPYGGAGWRRPCAQTRRRVSAAATAAMSSAAG